MSVYQRNKMLVLEFYQALENAAADNVADVIAKFCSHDCQFYGVHPFNELTGPEAIAGNLWRPLLESWSFVQRRQDIFIAGTSEIGGGQWVTGMGHFIGLFDKPWLDIPATNRIAFLRYADFNCVRDGKIVKIGFFCDLISVMKQAGYNPLPAQTGASFICPGPKTHDGIFLEDGDPADGKVTLELVNRMINDLNELNLSGNDHCPPEDLARTWHQDMIWYGPEGIGASYTIPGYQAQHQHPFREGLKDKVFNGHVCRYAEGNYACFFGWPNLSNTAKGGFLGLPASGIRADMRVVDIYRREGEKLAENWVIIDLPHWLKQQGLDILERMRMVLPQP